MRKYFLLLLINILSVFAITAQDQTNKGKDFWIPYPEHIDGTNSAMGLYITSDLASTGVITVGAVTIPFTVIPNTIVYKFLGPNGGGSAPNTGVYLGGFQDNVVSGRGIHVTATVPVVVFAHIIRSARSGATLVLPTTVWGKEYIVPGYANSGTSASYAEIAVYSSKPNTVIEITPKVATRNGLHVPGVAFQVTLPNVGDVYQLQFASNQDPSGTIVKSIASAGGCIPIAVFSATTWSGINCVNASGGDNFFQQLFPSGSWGKQFLTGPLKKVATNGSDNNVDIIRVFVKDPAAVVTKTEAGVTTTLTGLTPANYYQYTTSKPTLIQSDQPVEVIQYITSQTCGSPQTNSDPEMIALSAVEQTINDITVFSAHQNYVPTGQSQVTTHYINVIMKTSNTSLFRINGVAPNAVFTAIPATNYSYLKEDVSTRAAANPVFHLSADSGFSAIAYGFGNVESYGYNAGTNVKDLYQQIGVVTEWGIEPTPSVCTGAPFRFKVSLPYCVDSIVWNLSNLPAPPVPPIDTMRYNTCVPTYPLPGGPDSTTSVNGKTLYWYSLPSVYTVNTIGSYDILIRTFFPNGECGNSQDIPFTLQVSDPPVPGFTWSGSGCVAEPVQFLETTAQLPKPTYHWWWDFGDGNTITGTRNPLHLYASPGTYTVRYASITTPGCLSDTISQQITVAPLPTATASGNTTACINTIPWPTVTFTGTGGTAPYTFTYTINGGAPLTVNSPGLSAIATVQAPTAVAGTFIYELTKVQNVGSTLCAQNITGQTVTVNITADATLTLTSAVGTNNQTVCINNPIINITYAVSGSGTGGNVNGLPTGVTGTYAGGVISITGTPTVSGTFIYTVTTTGPCVIPTATGTITVTADATLALTSAVGTDNQTLCINTTLTNITYTVGGSGTGGSVSGLPAGVSATYAAGVITITGTPTVSGTFNYMVTTTGPCVKPTANGTITVTGDATLTLTSAVGTNNQTVCINIPITNITYSVGGTGTGGSVSGLPAGITGSFAGGIITITGTPTVSGIFNYTVTTTGPCVIPTATGTITVTADATLALTSAAGTDNQTICINTALTNITYAVGGTGTGGSVTGLPAGVNGTFAGGIITITGTPTVSGTFNYTVTTTGPCVKPTATGTITVTGDATLTLTSAVGTNNQTVCINIPITNITYAVGGTGTGGSVSGLPAGVTGTFSGGIITITGTPTVVGTFNYTVTTTGPCVIPSANGTITVNPDASITLTSAPATTSQQLCRNSTIIDITYLITGGGTGAGVTGLPTGVTGVFSGGVFTISGTPSVSGTFNYTVTTTGICVQHTATGTITVYALPTPDFSYTAPSCETRTISFTDLSVANSGNIISWTWNFGDGSPTDPTQNPTHVFALAGIYNVTLSITTNFGCINAGVFTRQVTINDRPLAGYIVPEVCLSDTYAQFTDTSHITNGVINTWAWNFGDPNATGGNPNTSALQNPTHSYTAVGNYTVQLIVTSALGCKDTITHILTVNGSFPVANFTVNNSTTLCANDSVAIVEASTVFPGVITKIEIYWDNVNLPAVFQLDDFPFTGKVYRHLYPNFQTPLTKIFTIRYRAYSGGVCVNDKLANITVNAAPLVQFNNMPDVCLLIPPFQITQASEVGGVPGTGVFSGPGVSATGLFTPAVAGVGTHTLMYTFTAAVGGCVDTMSNTITVLDTAHALFTYISPICENTAGSFTDLSTAPAAVTLSNTIWNFGDGSPIENHVPGANFTHLFVNPGTYTVTMYNVSAYGCNSTVYSEPVTIDSNHHITLNAGSNNNQTVCINTAISPIIYTLWGGATNVTVTGLPSGINYSLTGTVLTISGTPATTLLSPFTYSILTTGNTCVIAQASGTIVVEPDHTIALSSGNSSQSVCVNSAIDPITFDLGGGATGVTITGLPVGINYAVAGTILTISGTPISTIGGPTFNYSILTSGNSCIKATAAGSIKVNPYPVPMFAVDKPLYCIPNALVLFNNSSSVADGTSMTYSWDFGDGPPLNSGVSPSHWYSGIGPFNVKLIVRSGALLNGGIIGCPHDTTIIVNNIHPQPSADFSFNKPSVCVGDNVTITDNSDGKDGTINQWHWDLGDGSIRTTNPVTYVYTDTITFQVKLYTINSYTCNSDTITKPFTVYPYPHVNAGPDRYVLEGGQIVLAPVVYGNDLQFLWTPNRYLADNSIEKVRIINPLTDMTYRLTVTARGGCALSDDVFVKLLKFPIIPNTFTPNNDGINDVWRIDYLNTYPNNVVQIFTRSGQLVFQSRGYNTPWDGTIKGKPLPFDTYYYIIEPGSGRDPITGYVTIIK